MCRSFLARVAAGPADGRFATSGLGRHQSFMSWPRFGAGEIKQVGFADNLMLDRDVLATNAHLVDRAVGIIEWLGAQVIGPVAVRGKQGLRKQEMVR